MATLASGRDELLALFPRDLERLDILPVTHNPDQLYLLYVQHRAGDPRRDWPAYAAWKVGISIRTRKVRKRDATQPKLPRYIDELYHDHYPLFQQGHIALEDRILLLVNLIRREVFQPDVVLLGMLKRNQGVDCKGLGREFYGQMLGWLKGKGFRYLIGSPSDEGGLREYWQDLGQVPYASLDTDAQDYLDFSWRPKDLLVHTL